MPEKMLIKKFDPKARKHVDYKEMKLEVRRCACMGATTYKKTRPGAGFLAQRARVQRNAIGLSRRGQG